MFNNINDALEIVQSRRGGWNSEYRQACEYLALHRTELPKMVAISSEPLAGLAWTPNVINNSEYLCYAGCLRLVLPQPFDSTYHPGGETHLVTANQPLFIRPRGSQLPLWVSLKIQGSSIVPQAHCPYGTPVYPIKFEFLERSLRRNTPRIYTVDLGGTDIPTFSWKSVDLGLQEFGVELADTMEAYVPVPDFQHRCF